MALAAALALTFLAQVEPLTSPDASLAFAQSLAAEGDAYRAIGELKRYAFLKGGVHALRAQLLIGQLYAEAGQVDASRFHFARLTTVGQQPYASAARLLDLRNVCITQLLRGNCREQLDALPDELPHGLKPWLQATHAILVDPSALPAELPPQLAALAQARSELSLQRPWLAGLLSAVLPGAGQLYNRRPLDAALAFVLTGATTTGTVVLLAREKPEWGFAIPLGLLALVFYSGNIVNAVGDANRLNEQTWADFAARVQAEAWPRFTLAASPDGASIGLSFELPGAPPKRVLTDAE